MKRVKVSMRIVIVRQIGNKKQKNCAAKFLDSAGWERSWAQQKPLLKF